jgi:hypothetical protein
MTARQMESLEPKTSGRSDAMTSRRVTLIAAAAVLIALAGCGGDGDDQQETRVALLVIDEFDPASARPSPTPTPTDGDTDQCVFQGIATGEVWGKGAPDQGLPDGAVHGQLVLDEIRQEMVKSGKWGPQGADITDKASYGLDDPAVRAAETWNATASGTGMSIVLAGVHVEGYNTQQVKDLINKLVNDMKGKNFDRFVLNMSFVIAPCELGDYARNQSDPNVLLEMYRAVVAGDKDLWNLKNTLDALVGQSDDAIRSALLNLAELRPVRDIFNDPARFNALPDQVKLRVFYSPLDNGERTIRQDILNAIIDDPLHDYLDTLVTTNDRTKVVPVAAAGNGVGVDFEGNPMEFRLDFPFAPAIWKSVVSVSATSRRKKGDDKICADTTASAERAWYSNSGEVMLDGDLRYNAPAPSSSAASPSPQCILLTGTSFAAPRLSLQQALYLLKDGAIDCGTQPKRAVPPLGYVDGEDGKANIWLNQSVSQTAQDYCQDFETRIAAMQ